MTRVDRYLLRETLPPFFFGLALYTGLILLTNLLSRAQWVSGMPLLGLAKWLLYQVPFVLSQTLPIAVLLAVLLGYGRLSRENELLVMQASGIPLLRTARLLFVGGLLLAGVALYLGEKVVPWANQQVALVWWDQLATRGAGLYRLAGQDLPVGPYRLFFSSYDAKAGELKGVRLQQWQDQTLTVVFAERGQLQTDRLSLQGFRAYTLDLARLPLPDFSDLGQIEAYLRGLVRAQNVSRNPGASLVLRLPKTRDQLVAEAAGGGFESQFPLTYWWRKLQEPTLAPREALEAKVMLYSALAVPLANLVVLFLALPVAVRRAASPGIALGYSLVLTIGYYLVFGLGKIMAFSGLIPAELGVWGANLLALWLGWRLGQGVYR